MISRRGFRLLPAIVVAWSGSVLGGGANTALAQAGGPAAKPAPHRVADVPLAPDSVDHPPAPLVKTPAVVRGLYVNRWAATGTKVWQLIRLVKTTEVNALVIDVKDDRGLVLYRSRVPLAHEIGASGPSINRTISPMVILFIGFLRKYPPPLPRLLSK